ncbi:MAG TPA: hypothetical protein VMT35_12975 [Ignavibacteriaceae bacterium]|nr:hypothetical protein [Ignavibacteriaceae bacterium]
MKKTLLFLLFSIFILTALAQEAPSGKISGVMFADYFYNIQRDSTIGRKDFNGFQFRRIYFTYDFKINETFNTRFRLEGDQESNTSSSRIGVFIKDAFINWQDIFAGSNLTIGIQPTPAFDVSEGVWGYRSLEKTIMDLRDIVSSRDLAVSLRGRIDNNGVFNYWVMYGNGSGNRIETDKYKRYYLLFHVKPAKGFHLSLYGDLRARANKNYSAGSTSYSFINNYITTAFFAGYRDENKLSIGAEAVFLKKQNDISEEFLNSIKVDDIDALGISIFGSVPISSRFTGVARWDYFDPNIKSGFKGDLTNYFIAGLDYSPDKNFSIIPNVLIETFEKSASKEIDPSVTARITFSYSFGE